MNARARLVALTVAGLIATAAHGHHAISLNYDTERSGTIEGVVDEVFWANPHVHYYVTVKAEDGTEQTWDMEAPNVSVMSSRGIERDSITVGDRIEIEGTLGRDGSQRILATTIVKADGTVIMGGEEYGE